MAKAPPARVTELTVTAALPDEVKVSVLIEWAFNETPPKSRAFALTVNCGVGEGVPFPARVTVAVLPTDASLETMMVPSAVPATVGEKLTRMVIVCPGVSVAGNDASEMTNAAPVTLTEMIDSGALPVELRVMLLVAVVFSVTFPKSRVLALSVS